MDESDADTAMNRRQLLRTGSAALLMTGSVGTAVARDGQSEIDWNRFRNRVTERYGETEGNILTNIVKREFSRARQNGTSNQARAERVHTAVMSHPDLDSVQAEIRSVEINKQKHVSQSERATADISSSDFATQSQTLSLDQTYTNKNSYGNSRVRADAKKFYVDRAGYVIVNSAVYGSGNATARVYTSFNPSVSGKWDVAADYFRNPVVELGAEVTISAFKESSFGGVSKKTLEQTSSSVKGKKTRSASLELKSSTDYNIGFEARVEGAANGIASFGDVFNTPPASRRRQVRLKRFRVRSP